jgi:hypothetical protein
MIMTPQLIVFDNTQMVHMQTCDVEKLMPYNVVLKYCG